MSVTIIFILMCLIFNKVTTENALHPLAPVDVDFFRRIKDAMKQDSSTVVIFSSDGSDTFNAVINLLHPCPVIITNGKNIAVNPHIGKTTKYIFMFVDTVEEIVEQLEHSWNVRAYFHFVILRSVEDHLWLKSTVDKIWRNNILHFLIIYNHHNNLKMISYNPFFDEIINLTKSENKHKIYENKLRDMNGYPLHIGFFSDPPRIIEKNGVFYGIDAMILMGFSKKLKATVDIVKPGYAKTIDEKFMRHFFQIKRRKCDFGLVSCFTIKLDQLDVISSYPRRMDGIVVLIPHSAAIPQFYYMFMVFDEPVWVFIVISFIAVAFCKFVRLKCLNIPIDISKLLLQNWGTIFGVSLAIFQRNISLRFLFVLWASQCFTLNIHFQSLLTSNLVTPKFESNLNTLDELKSNNSIILINRANGIGINGQYPLNFIHTLSEHKIMQLITSGDTSSAYAIQSSVAELVSLKKSEDGYPVYHIIKELLLPGYTTYLFPSDSPYLNEINK